MYTLRENQTLYKAPIPEHRGTLKNILCLKKKSIVVVFIFTQSILPPTPMNIYGKNPHLSTNHKEPNHISQKNEYGWFGTDG